MAEAYIVVVASALFYAPNAHLPEKSVMIPIVVLSLFVLSAAMMGYFFIYQPACLFLEGKQKEATKLFLTTILSFAGITAVMVSVWLLLTAVL